MPLTPQQLAELQRLKELMRPQAEEFERRMRAVANAEKGSGQGVSLPTDKKAKGGLAEFLKDSAVKERLYHGTDKDFNVFNTPAYFSPDPEYASTGNISAGQNRSVMPVHLNLKNPARIDSTVKLTKQKINSLIKKGHDGAIGYINEYPFEYIAFHPHQIKSAIGNRGTYDPTNPDITKAAGGTIPSQDVMRLAIGGQGPKNWIKGGVEQVTHPLKSSYGSPKEIAEAENLLQKMIGLNEPGLEAEIYRLRNELDRAKNPHAIAINQWIDRNLTNYIKKQMATHDDPIRKLAEQGIVHMPPEQMGLNRYKANTHRATHGAERLGESDEAKAWEDATDVAMEPMYIRNLHPDYREPWMEKADPKTQIFTATNDMHAHYLGFDHLVDILKQDLAEGRIRPEQMSKVSIEHAVRRAHEYDQERKKAMAQTALKATEGMPVHKEYPEGYKWIELTLPEKGEHLLTELDKRIIADRKDNPVSPEVMDRTLDLRAHEKLDEALKYEGDTMGHCVGGYTPDVASGKSRIFSLRDAKNEPHVTIEVEPVEKHPIGYGMKGAEEFPKDFRYETGNIAPEQHQQIYQRAKQLFNPGSAKDIGSHRMDVFQQAADEVLGKPAPAIRQIKGKQNAKPKKDYIPYVQDFVKSGNWSDVHELLNADLYHVHPESDVAKKMLATGQQPPTYVTNQELTDITKKYNKAHGGRVTHAHHLEIEERPL